ncbi:MAG: hypothetical protein ACK4S4_11675 [Pyrinomonadaceae bacterium]
MKFKLIDVTAVVVVMVIASVLGASAQGRYANIYSRAQVNGFIRQLEESSDRFRQAFEREVDNSGLNGSTRRQYKSYAAQFENAVDRLRERFDRGESWWSSRDEVRDMIANSQDLNSTMNNASFRRRLERQWNRLRDDINKLADTYDLPGLAGGGWNGGGDWDGGGRGDVPSWARGTFYGRDPRSGGSITLTIERDGRVMISIDGNAPTYGSMQGTTLRNGPYVSRVTRLNNGIRTTDVENGSYIDYYRGSQGGGGWNGGQEQGNVPSWAVGSFYGTNPQTGGTITLTIESNGRVTIMMDRGEITYATMNGTTLTNGPYVSRVSRRSNGIRTTDVNNGSYIDYYRR